MIYFLLKKCYKIKKTMEIKNETVRYLEKVNILNEPSPYIYLFKKKLVIYMV